MSEEHPFAPFVRILGKGKTGTRSLTRDEAREAFGMILRGDVEELQLGAFLMLLRVKEESAEELAGFVDACRAHLPDIANAPPPQLDWPSYAGKKAQQPWYLLSALLLAENGISVLMHGSGGHTAQRLYTGQCMSLLGVPDSGNLQNAVHHSQQHGIAWLPLNNLLPGLERIIQLKHLLGLRSPVNTLTRMLNPAGAPYSLQSIFHPAYAVLHQEADRMLGQQHALVFKGDGGEVEIKPQADTRYSLLRGDHISTGQWSRRLEDRPPVVELSAEQLLLLWRGQVPDTYGELAIIETTAIALFLTERAGTEEEARELASNYWQQRNRDRL